MDSIHLSIVRPDRLVWEGDVHHVILSTMHGEMGIWPLHGPEIVALGSGVIRVHREAEGAPAGKVIVQGGYAEISDDELIVLADHARRTDDVEPSVVKLTRRQAAERRDTLPEGEEHRAAYYDNKIAWCDLLLKYGEY